MEQALVQRELARVSGNPANGSRVGRHSSVHAYRSSAGFIGVHTVVGESDASPANATKRRRSNHQHKSATATGLQKVILYAGRSSAGKLKNRGNVPSVPMFPRFDNAVHGLGFRTDKQVEDLHHKAGLFLHEHGIAVEGLSYAGLIKTYQTYTKPNPQTGQTYSGRTSGTGTPEENVADRDSNHHMNEQGYGPATLDKSTSNSNAIRGREQQLIELNGGAQSQGGTSGNRINGVSPMNPNAELYEGEAAKEWGGDELYKAYEIYGVRIPGLTGH
jgi:hypothetical protein